MTKSYKQKIDPKIFARSIPLASLSPETSKSFCLKIAFKIRPLFGAKKEEEEGKGFADDNLGADCDKLLSIDYMVVIHPLNCQQFQLDQLNWPLSLFVMNGPLVSVLPSALITQLLAIR